MMFGGEYARIQRDPFRWVACICAITACTIVGTFLPTTVFAQASVPATPMTQVNGGVVQLPAKPPFSRRSGLAISVDPRWTNSYGYWPIEVTVTAAKTSTSDRIITIKLHSGWNRTSSAEQSFVLPAGSTVATTLITLPVFQTPMNRFWWDFYVNGMKDKDLSIDEKSSQAWMGGASSSGAGVEFLVAGPSRTNRGLVSTNGMELQILSLKLSSFPTRWIDYSSFDVVSLSRNEVDQLVTQQPAAWDAICHWVRAGGSLWISDVGQQLEHLTEVSQLFKLPSRLATDNKSDAANADAPSDGEKKDAENNDTVKKDGEKQVDDDAEIPTIQEGWRSLRFRNASSDGKVVTFLQPSTGLRQTVRDPDVIARRRADSNFMVVDERVDPAAAALPERRKEKDSSKWFVEQNYGLGTVRAFRGANEAAQFPLTSATAANAAAIAQMNANANSANTPDPVDELPPALDTGMRRTLHWDARHGMTPDSANTEFVKFMVPGVGQAPVSEFRVLITLFVLLIGPLNYWWLKRAKRLHLMVLTVPLAAAVTTAALFGYAIVADGFDTRVRAHSYTKLDQKVGEAVCWSRLSYYSGLSPGNGLTIPADVVMYPILPAWAGDWNLGEQREMTWAGNDAMMTQGWLNSRTPTQYLTVRSRRSPINLEVLDSGDKLRVKNQLGATIKTLIVVSQAGKMYLGDNIGVDASAQLQPIERDEASKIIGKLITESTPQAPPELGLSDSAYASMQSRSRYGQYGVQLNTGRMAENLAGSALADLAGLSGQPALQLPPRSYVAITETGPEVELGISYAKEEASFHLIEGRY